MSDGVEPLAQWDVARSLEEVRLKPFGRGLSIVRQCALLSISRSGFYYEPVGEDAATLALMRAIDDAYLKFPSYGSRQMARYRVPAIFNTDQGSQYTSPRFTGVLASAGIQISMDGSGRWMDNVFIERLWRSLKYECIYLLAFETGGELRAGLTAWIGHYNSARPYSKLAGQTPDEVYSAGPPRCPGLAPRIEADLPVAA